MFEKPVILVQPERLQSAIWGYAEGDISGSYSADRYGEEGRVREPFTHQAFNYVAMGLHWGGLDKAEAVAYPILPEAKLEEIVANRIEDEGRGYSGRKLTLRGQACVFGHPVIFRRRPLTKAEITDYSRRMFAYGGYFSTRAGSYERFVREMLEKVKLDATRNALQAELESSDLPQSQAAMKTLIESKEQPDREQGAQLDLL